SRNPSCLISWTQPSPLGSRSAGEGRQGSINADTRMAGLWAACLRPRQGRRGAIPVASSWRTPPSQPRVAAYGKSDVKKKRPVGLLPHIAGEHLGLEFRITDHDADPGIGG